MSTPLTIYKASAGSGKTFTLAVEYIKLLINNPKAYENILAVTFTNKATEEMKTRILSQLYGIAHNLPDSKDYLKKVCQELDISEKTASLKAAQALDMLLHNYNFFRIQTIDTFFQSVMRNLAKELSLNNSMRLSLNDKQVVSQAVDCLMETLNDNKQLLEWIQEYVNEQIDDEKSWDVSNDIKTFGINLTRELYKEKRNRLADVYADDKFFERYKNDLKRIKNDILIRYSKASETFLNTLKDNNLSVDSLSNKSRGPAGYFLKLGRGELNDIFNDTARKAAADPKKWASQKSKDAAIITHLAETVFNPLINELEKDREKDANLLNSVNITLDNMNKLRLLHSIESEIVRLNGEHGRFMLSDTQTLLFEMMKNDHSIAPFIYEKIGARLDHIMIDEFQDTSRVQWANFKVLLQECMSRPLFDDSDPRTITNNLIVGDVKQSIYRFRSGDWRLLNGIDDEFGDMCQITPLQTNYRSCSNIINFNSLFFQIAARLESRRIARKDWVDSLLKAYSDVAQLVPGNKDTGGYVSITLLKGTDKNENQERILASIMDNVDTILSQGAKQSDIAILVRGNGEATLIANYLSALRPDLNIVSEEAFKVMFSQSVRLIISTLRWLLNPSDKFKTIQLASAYVNTIFEEDKRPDMVSFLANSQDILQYLPSSLTDAVMREQLLSLPLSALCEEIFRILHLDAIQGETAYICTFFDLLRSFVADFGSSVADFLTNWDETLCKKNVVVGEIEGIRIMTIHKSKGLEFDHVIMPFANWEVLPNQKHPVTLWCETDSQPFSELPLIPVTLTSPKTLDDSIYSTFGDEEVMQYVVDNLNLLYVDFTRASKSLIVISEHTDKEGGRAKLIADTLGAISSGDYLSEDTGSGSQLQPLEGFTYSDDDECVKFEMGSIAVPAKSAKTTSNVFLQQASAVEVNARSLVNSNIMFRQSNKSRDFANDVTDDDDSRRYMRMGTLLHQLFATITSIDDVERVLRQFEFDGMLYDDDITPESIRAQINSKFRNPQVREWFDPHWHVYNESTIIFRNEEGRVAEERPDRVITDGNRTIVIDYKFGKPQQSHHNQVRHYMQLLTEVCCHNVEGYIWYVTFNRIVRV